MASAYILILYKIQHIHCPQSLGFSAIIYINTDLQLVLKLMVLDFMALSEDKNCLSTFLSTSYKYCWVVDSTARVFLVRFPAGAFLCVVFLWVFRGQGQGVWQG